MALEVAGTEQGAIYLHAFRPWIANLAQLTVCARAEYEDAQASVRRILRQLIGLSAKEGSVRERDNLMHYELSY